MRSTRNSFEPGSTLAAHAAPCARYFLIVDDKTKTKIWRDFGYPGAEQLIEPAPNA